jgi:competence ComEA-like helix-hairpin-helix protein
MKNPHSPLFSIRRAIALAWLFTVLTLASAASPATKKPPLKPVNLNSATSEELQEVPGIGPATADKILQMRKSYGAFKSVDDLVAIRGIGKKRLDKMRKYLTVGKPTAASKAGQSSGCGACAKALAVKQQAPAAKPIAPTKSTTIDSSPAESESEAEEPQSR